MDWVEDYKAWQTMARGQICPLAVYTGYLTGIQAHLFYVLSVAAFTCNGRAEKTEAVWPAKPKISITFIPFIIYILPLQRFASPFRLFTSVTSLLLCSAVRFTPP